MQRHLPLQVLRQLLPQQLGHSQWMLMSFLLVMSQRVQANQHDDDVPVYDDQPFSDYSHLYGPHPIEKVYLEPQETSELVRRGNDICFQNMGGDMQCQYVSPPLPNTPYASLSNFGGGAGETPAQEKLEYPNLFTQTQRVTTNEDSPLSFSAGPISILSNESAYASLPMHVVAVNGSDTNVNQTITLPSGALLSVKSNGALDYDPNDQYEHLAVGETATDKFTYTLTNGFFTSLSSTLVTIVGVNDIPTAAPVTATTAEEVPIFSIDITPFTGDVDLSDILSYSATFNVGASEHPAGSFTLDANTGILTIFPQLGFQDLSEGQAVDVIFDYAVDDGNGGLAESTVTITVVGENDAPTATPVPGPDTHEDANLYVFDFDDAIGVDLPIQDVDQLDDLTVTLTQNAAESERLILFEHEDNIFSFDTGQFNDLAVGDEATLVFDYIVSDQHGAIDNSIFEFMVHGRNDVPWTFDSLIYAMEDGPVVSDIFYGDDFDNDDNQATLAYYILNQPSEGSVSNNNDGTFSFDPGTDFQDLINGEFRNVTFDFLAMDSHGAVSNMSTVTIAVEGSGQQPVADNDTITVSEDGPFASPTINVLANDYDLEGESFVLTRLIVDGMNYALNTTYTVPAGDIFRLDSNGTFSYDPNDLYESLSATDTATRTVSYEIINDSGLTDTGDIVITIDGENDNPNFTSFSFAPTSVNVFDNAVLSGSWSDVDTGETFTVVVSVPSIPFSSTIQTASTATSFSGFNLSSSNAGLIQVNGTVTDSQGAIDTITTYLNVLPKVSYMGDTRNLFIDLASQQTSQANAVGTSGDGTFTEVSPNSYASPNSLNNQGWETGFDVNIDDINNNDISTVIPHISIAGTGDGTFDFYSFTVGPEDFANNNGSLTVVLDTDFTTNNVDRNLSFDPELQIWDPDGILLSENDDKSGAVDDGSDVDLYWGFGTDSFLQIEIVKPGTYVIGVSEFPSTASNNGVINVGPGFGPYPGIPDPGDVYTLQVSVDQVELSYLHSFGGVVDAMGGDGNDVLVGNSSNNILTGNGGTDVFVIAPAASQSDTITDFNRAADFIDISAFNYSSTANFTSIVPFAGGSTVTLNTANVLTVFHTGTLDNSDFLF